MCVLDFLANLFVILVLISVHETGHFLAGWAVGVPAVDMRIRLFCFPQHVALRDGTEWVPPSDLQRYLRIMRRHLHSPSAEFVYVAGGLLLETVFAVAVTIIAKLSGAPGPALMVAGLSLIFYLILAFFIDLPLAIYRRYPWGRFLRHVVPCPNSSGPPDCDPAAGSYRIGMVCRDRLMPRVF